ncbi:MAG: ATP-binding protein, partial [Oscillospiraceae bacterium]|nr:ATP-binding protein [Oscillospiraceae bacterium]
QVQILNATAAAEAAAKSAAKAAQVAENAAQIAEAASKSKSTFLANMSHEIRTPMNAIMGITDILMQIEQLPEEIEDGLEKIYASSEMLLGIINDILDFSKIEAGKLDIIAASYEVASMVNDAVHLNMMRIGNRPIRFELQIDEEIPALLIGDELRIKQILNNLLSNAFKYTDAGKVTLVFNYEQDTNCLVLCVSDTGHGMTQEQLGRLFEEYSRFGEERSRNIEGTGLGLSILQRLVNLMEGEITVESEPQVGTTVTVRLPQTPSGSGIIGQEVAANLQSFRKSSATQSHRRSVNFAREPMPYGRILVVDDTETNLFVAQRLMKPYKLQIETAINGLEAVEKVIRNDSPGGFTPYDVIFMDHMMPVMDGIEATRILRERGYEGVIVALTANAVSGQADMFLENGFDGFVSKPINTQQLNATLNKFVRDKQPPDVLQSARMSAAVPSAEEADESMLYESFVRDAQKAVVILSELDLSSEQAMQKFTIIVHGMKSSLWSIGEKTLSQRAGELEQAGRDKNIELITTEVPAFLNALRTLLEKHESEVAAIDTSNDADTNPENLRETLTAIAQMCADYNRGGALDLIAKVKECSSDAKKLLCSVKEHILYSNFEEAHSELSDYI